MDSLVVGSFRVVVEDVVTHTAVVVEVDVGEAAVVVAVEEDVAVVVVVVVVAAGEEEEGEDAVVEVVEDVTSTIVRRAK